MLATISTGRGLRITGTDIGAARFAPEGHNRIDIDSQLIIISFNQQLSVNIRFGIG